MLFPGGYGTLDELFESLTLIQTRKLSQFPVILIGRSYWQGLLDWFRDSPLGHGNICPEDLELLYLTDSAEEARELLTRAYREEFWRRIPGGAQDGT